MERRESHDTARKRESPGFTPQDIGALSDSALSPGLRPRPSPSAPGAQPLAHGGQNRYLSLYWRRRFHEELHMPHKSKFDIGVLGVALIMFLVGHQAFRWIRSPPPDPSDLRYYLVVLQMIGGYGMALGLVILTVFRYRAS